MGNVFARMGTAARTITVSAGYHLTAGRKFAPLYADLMREKVEALMEPDMLRALRCLGKAAKAYGRAGMNEQRDEATALAGNGWEVLGNLAIELAKKHVAETDTLECRCSWDKKLGIYHVVKKCLRFARKTYSKAGMPDMTEYARQGLQGVEAMEFETWMAKLRIPY